MTLSENGYKFIKAKESCRLHAYPDEEGNPTIGYGNTYYEDGTPVKLTDEITWDRAGALFKHTADNFAKHVDEYLDATVNQNQFDALVSIAYNIGKTAFAKSTLLKKVDANPADPQIRNEFAKWNKERVKGVLRVSPGLSARRRDEANLYFQPLA